MTAKTTIPDVLDDFKRYHTRHGAWGSLHIVLDDNNCTNDHVRYCIECAQRRGDMEGERLARILLTMSRTQRSKLGRVA